MTISNVKKVGIVQTLLTAGLWSINTQTFKPFTNSSEVRNRNLDGGTESEYSVVGFLENDIYRNRTYVMHTDKESKACPGSLLDMPPH